MPGARWRTLLGSLGGLNPSLGLTWQMSCDLPVLGDVRGAGNSGKSAHPARGTPTGNGAGRVVRRGEAVWSDPPVDMPGDGAVSCQRRQIADHLGHNRPSPEAATALGRGPLSSGGDSAGPRAGCDCDESSSLVRRIDCRGWPFKPLAWGLCSPDWTRTNNPAINSRMLCQLSYGGRAGRDPLAERVHQRPGAPGAARPTLAYRATGSVSPSARPSGGPRGEAVVPGRFRRRLRARLQGRPRALRADPPGLGARQGRPTPAEPRGRGPGPGGRRPVVLRARMGSEIAPRLPVSPAGRRRRDRRASSAPPPGPPGRCAGRRRRRRPSTPAPVARESGGRRGAPLPHRAAATAGWPRPSGPPAAGHGGQVLGLGEHVPDPAAAPGRPVRPRPAGRPEAAAAVAVAVHRAMPIWCHGSTRRRSPR